MTLMRCYVTNACLCVLPSPLQPHAVWTSQGGKLEGQRIYGLAHRTSCLKHPTPSFSALPSIATNSKFGNNDNYFPCSPAPRILTRLVWRRLPFLKSTPLTLPTRFLSRVRAGRTTALALVCALNPHVFFLVSDPFLVCVNVINYSISKHLQR